MIFSEQDLHITANAYDIINESAWIDGGNINTLRFVPLVESSSIGGYIVKFNDIEAFSEEYGIDYIDTMLAIAESHSIDPSYLAVAIDEYKIIQNPDLIYELANVITVPQSPNSPAYEFCEACIKGYMYTGDENFLELLTEEYTTNSGIILPGSPPPKKVSLVRPQPKRELTGVEKLERSMAKWKSKKDHKAEAEAAEAQARANAEMENWGAKPEVEVNSYDNFGEKPKKDAAAEVSAQGAPETAKNIKDEQLKDGQIRHKNGKIYDTVKDEKEGIIDKIKRVVGGAAAKGADWIARKISALRHMYQAWQEKARKARAEGNASWFQQVGSRVLNVIDWALDKLENMLQANMGTRIKYGMKIWQGDNIADKHIGQDQWEKNQKNPPKKVSLLRPPKK